MVAYNIAFERGCLNGLAETFPEHADRLNDIAGRLVDLITPFRGFSYYHPNQHGSASLKAVLPAITGRSYEGLEISEGETAGHEFLRVEHGQVDEEERQRVRESLESYCCMDTMAMVWIVEALGELVG